MSRHGYAVALFGTASTACVGNSSISKVDSFDSGYWVHSSVRLFVYSTKVGTSKLLMPTA